MTSLSNSELWERIKSRLDTELPEWRSLIELFGQVQAIKDRASGKNWTDDRIQEALVRSVLSSNTDWSRLEAVLPDLNQLFYGFSLHFYAGLTVAEIDERFIPWFKERKAASMTLGKDLKNLIKTSRKLQDWSQTHGSAEHYFTSLFLRAANDPKKVALQIGLNESKYKLPAFGVPLAAEALRNMGFDLAKPDRHILRAAGSFGLAQFSKWPDMSDTKSPQPNKSELLSTMTAIEDFAASLNEYTAYVDNAIWLLCAKSGLRLSNRELKQLASR
jgi:hypothetical protein